MNEDLKSLDLNALPTLTGFDVLDESKLANVDLRLDKGRATPARYVHSYQVIDKAAGAAAQLQRIPEPGESIHMVLNGEFSLFDFIPAVVHLTDGAPIQELQIATLGFSRKNVDALAALYADKLIESLSILCSHYFSAVDSDIFRYFTATLPQAQIVAMRTHAKLLLIKTRGEYLTVESSANLRSCHNVEQATMTNATPLYTFHQEWIEKLKAQGNRNRGASHEI